MLSISTIPEALAELEKLTGRAWTESELFAAATECGVQLHAAAPASAQTATNKFVDGRMVEIVESVNDFDWLLEPFVVPNSHSGLAVLFPAQINQLRISGETLTSYPSNHDEKEGEIRRFTQPVRVTRESVRIKPESLHKIKARWDKAQGGTGAPLCVAPSLNVHGIPSPPPKVEAVRGVGKREVMAAFQGLKWDYDHWGKNLASPSDRLKACRVARGNKTTTALWNPVDIGLYLLDERQPLKRLDAVFVGLGDWIAEWQEKTQLER